MKKLIKIFAIIILTIGFTSCDVVDDLTERDFNTTLTESFTVTLEDGIGKDVSQSISVSIDNDDTHDYLSKIKDVKINSLTYRVTNHSGDDTANVDVVFFADLVDMMNHAIVIKQASDNPGTVFKVDDVSYFNAIASKLKNGNSVETGIRGTSNSGGVTTFTVVVTIDVKVTASAS